MGRRKYQPTRVSTTTIILILIVIIIATGYYLFYTPQGYLSSKYVELRNRCQTCSQAKELASKDFESENYQIVAWD